MLYLVNHSPHAAEEDDRFCKVPDNFFWNTSFSKPTPIPLHSMINLILYQSLTHQQMYFHTPEWQSTADKELLAVPLHSPLPLAWQLLWHWHNVTFGVGSISAVPAWSTTAQISSQEAKLRIRKIISSWAYRQLKPWSLLIIAISQTLSVTNMFRVHRGKGWRFKPTDFKARRIIVSSLPSQCIFF